MKWDKIRATTTSTVYAQRHYSAGLERAGFDPVDISVESEQCWNVHVHLIRSFIFVHLKDPPRQLQEQRTAAYQVQDIYGNEATRPRLVPQSGSCTQEQLPNYPRLAAQLNEVRTSSSLWLFIASHVLTHSATFIASPRVRLAPARSFPGMISDTTLTTLSNGLGIAAMGLIVLYHFVAVNGKRMEQ